MNTSEQVEEYIASFADWRGEQLAELRQLINDTAPELKEDFKWGVPVWSSDKLVCAISAFKDHVKLNFFQGASLEDKHGLFNSGLDSKDHRSINFAENDALKIAIIQEMIQAATAHNKK